VTNIDHKIPLFDLNYGKEEELAVLKTLRSKWISMGPEVNKLEEEFAKHLNITHVVAVTNCTAALHLALNILGIKEGDQVIVPSLTFVATVNAVRYVGATPVFADIKSYEDLSIDPTDIEKRITSQTKAIIVMHYGGFACAMDSIMKTARQHNLFVIEDAAHAPGSEYKGQKLGTIGDISCFSFFSNKNISCAEGGVLATNTEEYAQKARLLRSHGMTTLSYERAKGHATEYDVVALGYNYRMDDIRAALALSQLRKLKRDTEKRQKIRDCYLEELKHINEVVICYKNHPYKSSNYIFPVVLKNSNAEKRDRVRRRLSEAGIQTSVHYPAVHGFSIYERFTADLPKTDYVTDNEITLPLFFNLTRQQVQYISSVLKEILNESDNNNR
jgi:dTDP-4-amino-4,6-dideoxygalactose transaminase